MTSHVLPRPTRGALPASYAPEPWGSGHASLGLGRRSIAFEAAVALLGTVVVGLGNQTPSDRLLPLPVVLGLTPLIGVTLFLFRRSAPLIPFLLTAALAVAAPAVTIAVPLTAYAVGRYEGRWPRADRRRRRRIPRRRPAVGR